MASAAARQQLAVLAEAKYRDRVKRARDNLETFIELCGRNEEGYEIELHVLHRAWVWHVMYCWSRGLNAMILAPFGSGKSSTLAVPLAAWLIGCNPQIRVKMVSNADDYAKRRVNAAKMIMETAEYRAVFPHIQKGRKWGDQELEVKRRGHLLDATLHARGVKTKGVGTRADVIVFDDVCDELNTQSKDERDTIKGFCRNTWMSRLDQREGRALWIATPWDPDDATADFMHDRRWCTLVQRVSQDLEHYDQEVFNAGADYTQDMIPR